MRAMTKAVWFILGSTFVVAMLTTAHRDDPAALQAEIARPVASVAPITPVTGAITLARANDGHFYADASVNGAPVRFIVDTGATTIALSKTDARNAGIAFTDADFTGTARSAGGVVRVKPVMLDRVAIGTSESRGVDAAIVDGDLPVSLLGQSYLKRFGNLRITGDTMVLN